MKNVNLVFPNQLFKTSPLLEKEGVFLIIEEILFFKHFKKISKKILNVLCGLTFIKVVLLLLFTSINVYRDGFGENTELILIILFLENKIKSFLYSLPKDK